jgi:hypothetical protein
MLETGCIRCKFLVAVSAFVSRMLGLRMLIQGFSGAKFSVADVAAEAMFRSLMLISSLWGPERTVTVVAFNLVLRLVVHTESIIVDKITITKIALRHGGSNELGGWAVDTVEVPVTPPPGLTSIKNAAVPEEGEDSKIWEYETVVLDNKREKIRHAF